MMSYFDNQSLIIILQITTKLSIQVGNLRLKTLVKLMFYLLYKYNCLQSSEKLN